MPYEIQSHGYDILIIQFGMNDCNYWHTDGGLPRVSKMAFEANLNEIIDRGLQFGAKKTFLNTNHPTPRTEKFVHASISYQESNIEYNQIIRRVGNYRKNIILNDVETYIVEYLEKDNLMVDKVVLSDRLHLSELGHQIYFDFIYPRLQREIMDLI